MENSQRSFKNHVSGPSPDKGISLLQLTLVSLDQVVNFSHQPDEKFVGEDRSVIENVIARIRSDTLELYCLKDGLKDQLMLILTFSLRQIGFYMSYTDQLMMEKSGH